MTVCVHFQGFSSDGNAQNRVVLKNFLYVYKNYSVLESFAELAREYYLTDVKSVARPDLEVRRNFEDDKSPAEAPADESATSGSRICVLRYKRDTFKRNYTFFFNQKF